MISRNSGDCGQKCLEVGISRHKRLRADVSEEKS